MLLTMVFSVGGFLITVKRPYVQLSSPGQTEGLKGGFKEWVDGWAAGWVDGWVSLI
jgi:hypothetical protein